MVKSYLLTLKNNACKFVNHITLMDELHHNLDNNILNAKSATWHPHIGIELDSLCRLHAHAIITTPNNISCKMTSKEYNHDSFHVNLKPIYTADLPKVVNYITKEKREPEELEQISYEHFIQRRLKRYNLFSKSFIVYKKIPSNQGVVSARERM